MLETGQPLHAFDYDLLEGHQIVVKCAGEGEPFVTLDGKERILDSNTLMICDGKRTVAIAGVMGGGNSEISDTTKNVLLESACFEAANVRRTSKYLGLSTEASQRFERGIDVDMTLIAANRAAQLFQELAGAEVLKGVIDVYPKKKKSRTIALRVSRVNAILGTDLSVSKILSYLKRLGISARKTKSDVVSATIPGYRNDLIEEIDLIEEVARMFGYNNIEIRTDARINLVSVPESENIEDAIRENLVGAGFNEIVTNSLQNKARALLSGEPPVEVLNPVSVDMQMLRPSLIPGALDVIRHNFNHGQSSLRMFEFGKVYRRNEGGNPDDLSSYSEELRLLLVLSGTYLPQHYSSSSRSYDFFDMKGEVESLLSKFFLDKYRLICYDNGKPLSVDNIRVEIQGTYAGFLGTLKKQIAATFDIDRAVFLCELSIDVLQDRWKKEVRFSQLPKFPSVTRDLAFVVNRDVPQADVEKAMNEAGGSLLKNLNLFDLYVGEQVGEGKKSLAYALELQPTDHTLTDQEANAVITRIVDLVKSRCGAVLRS
jgi:phenylalanyl-tRNA synthetase beta chain